MPTRKRIASVPGITPVISGGAPTAIFIEQDQRSDKPIYSLNVNDQEQRRDQVAVNPVLQETVSRGDVLRIPTVTIKGQDAVSRGESVLLASIVQDKAQRGDKTSISVTYQSAGTFAFTVPPNVTTIKAICRAGGGAGGILANASSGGGGGGGAYSQANAITVTPGASLSVVVGASGGDSSFVNAGTVLAKAGSVGANGTVGAGGAGGPGGAAASGVGDVKFSGGVGAQGQPLSGGGAGGGSGNAGDGSAGSGGTGGAGGNAGGGTGGAGGTAIVKGTSGTIPGGGGGGSIAALDTSVPGSIGLVTLSWTA